VIQLLARHEDLELPLHSLSRHYQLKQLPESCVLRFPAPFPFNFLLH